jgi:hypothetical protein
MRKGRRPAASKQARCPDCKSPFIPTDAHPLRCALCAGQMSLPFPRPRDAHGRFLSGGAL